jgi:hypothetical protein
MIELSLKELHKIADLCFGANIESFNLKRDFSSGIGSILTLSYDTFVADYPATVTIKLNGVEDW